MTVALASLVVAVCLVVFVANLFLIVDQIKGGEHERDGE